MDATTLQVLAAFGAMLLLMMGLIGGWITLAERRLERRMDMQHTVLMERMDRLENRMDRIEDRMDRNHQEIMALLMGHTHGEGPPATFNITRLTRPAD